MKFANKIFLTTFSISTIVAASIGASTYCIFKQTVHADYYQRYEILGRVLVSSFNEMEKLSDSVNMNAILALKIINEYRSYALTASCKLCIP